MVGGEVHTLNGVGDERDVAQNPQNSDSLSCTHSVQFYEDQVAFLDKLAEFAGTALGTGGSCLILATPEHRAGLAERLEHWAIDVRYASQCNRLISIDARELLARFMVEGWPSREEFCRALEPELVRAKSAVIHKSGAVFAFGDMVALLWEGAHYEAAIQLEQIWNEMSARHSFSLLCAYPISCFAHESQHELFARICREHTHVVPTESYASLLNESERLPMVSSLQQKAAIVRSFLEERERVIAQRRHVEDKLWRSEEFARKVVGSGMDSVQVLDVEGRLEYISPPGQAALEIRDLTGYLGRNWADLWKEEDRPRMNAALEDARAGGVGSFQGDCATVSGVRKYWDVRITPARGPDGQIERLIAVSRDITELRQAQQIAIQAEKLAAAGRMAATIAHEINNPLEAVTNFIYLARTTPDLPEEAGRHLEIADRELARVAQIAQKTLGFYRDTSRNKWVSVTELVDDVMLIYERKLRYKQIRSAVSVAPGLKVFAKVGELKQALSNLLANAIDASRQGGCIWVRAHAGCTWGDDSDPDSDSGIRITVADNGTGMSPEVQKRIFVPFFTTKGNIGTGIGLWVTKSLIEQQGGSMRFRSCQGARSGTIMSFFLPASNPRLHETASGA
jgi:PAS domain S-box-containing protein